MSQRLYILLVLVILIPAYCGSYLFIRSQHYIAHYSGYGHGNTMNHRMDIGNRVMFPTTKFTKTETTIALASYFLFTPLRWIETGYWHIKYPIGKPWPYYPPNKT